MCLILFLISLAAHASSQFETLLNLPATHLPYYHRNFPNAAQYWCADRPVSSNCEAATDYGRLPCWGYEWDCGDQEAADRFGQPTCPGAHTGLVASKAIQLDTFFTQADFGYIRQQMREMRIICEPLFANDSVLECSRNMRFCRGRNLWMDFTALAPGRYRYKTDVLAAGQFGGFCKLYADRMVDELEHKSALQSWAPEVQHFVALQRRPSDGGDCDRYIDKPTFIMKIDAVSNMYHHFCDFLNLYASQHLNATHPASFSTDVQILLWETFPYRSPFADVFRVFTSNPIMTLADVRGQRICLRNVVMPLLPRMIFGLYYNTPIIDGCERSGLFTAFAEHVLHRLAIPLLQRKRDDQHRLRITLLSRKTRFRNINNVDELLGAIRRNESYSVEKVEFDNISFRDQLRVTRNTDIFIGMHGAGLTHLLFLPAWASLFELYNCEDAACYRDLARLKGVNYVTWERRDLLQANDVNPPNEPMGGSHEKFMNYSFDVDEFVRLVNRAADHVFGHEAFQRFIWEHNESDHSAEGGRQHEEL